MKRLYLKLMQNYDQAYSTSYTRLVEMTVDGMLAFGHESYSIQFWRDVQTYGLHEAFVYLRNSKVCNGDLADLEKLVDKLCPQMLENLAPPSEDVEIEDEPCQN